ncbi:hypothetical protein Tco_1048382 [Tanacetum coccineum]
MPRGGNRGRDRGRRDNREFLHENRTKALDNNYQNGVFKSVRGGGPRTYRPVTKNNVEAPANNRRRSMRCFAGMEKLYIDNSGSSYQARNKGRGQTGQAMPGSITWNLTILNAIGAGKGRVVMQFAGQQHPGGITAVGMAFPGYVGQPNGMGNSEMTWLPVLAGAARGLGAYGAMGAAYPPYITMDGSYHAQTSGQASSLAPALSIDGLITMNQATKTETLFSNWYD